MAYPEDPDFSGVDALPDPNAAPKLSTELDALATAIQATATGVNGDAGGKTPDEVVAAANAAANATRDAATNAATAEAAIKILKDAVAAWKKDAPKKADLDKAEKRVTDAGTALAAAQKAYDEAKDDTAKALVKPVLDSAVAEQQAAILALQTMKNKRKAADEAYETARKQAAEKMKTLKASDEDREGDSPGAPGKPSTPGTSTQPTGTGSGTPAAAKPSGAPATAKPTGSTPAATAPSGTAPSSTTGQDSDLNTALAAAALAGQNQNQQPQQAAATTPQASTPHPQQQNQAGKKDDPSKKSSDAIDVDDLIREGALPASAAAATLTGVGGANPTTAAPAANGTTTTFRPASAAIPGTLPGGTPAPQSAPVVSGRSFDNLNTQSDVGGRPPGTENKPFAPGLPEPRPAARTVRATAPSSRPRLSSRRSGAPACP